VVIQNTQGAPALALPPPDNSDSSKPSKKKESRNAASAN
jgi:hypothetical protein